MAGSPLVGIGLYTPSEAEKLIGVSARRLVRWLSGHSVRDRHYEKLWQSQIDLRDDRVYLGFRDLMEARVADAFIGRGLSPQKVRRAIQLAREIIGEERPLSTSRFRTDGNTVFLRLFEEDGGDGLVDLFRKQYALREVIEPSLKNVDFDEHGVPERWWPRGKAGKVVLDPARAFGRPIEAECGVPTAILASAVAAEGSVERAARAWAVPPRAIRHSVDFETGFSWRKAA